MMKRFITRCWAVTAVSALVFTLAFGCGDPEDPTQNQNDPTQNQNDPNDNDPNDNDPNDNDPNDNDPNDNDPNDNDPNDNDPNDNDPNDNDPNDNDPNDNNGEGCSDHEDCAEDEYCDDATDQCVDIEYTCELEDWFHGQITDDEGIPNAGGEPTTDPFETSSGLQDAIDAIEDELADYSADEIGDEIIDIELDEGIDVEGATVTAVEWKADTRFWLGDADTGLYLRSEWCDDYDEEEEECVDYIERTVPDEPYVGDVVDFTIEALRIYQGTPQIRDWSDWEVTDSDADVSFIELGDDTLDLNEHYARIVRVGGQLTNNYFPCGANCYVMNYGPDGQHSTVFRTSSDYSPEPGDCVTFIGPISSFPGVYTDDPEAQVDVSEAPEWGEAWGFW